MLKHRHGIQSSKQQRNEGEEEPGENNVIINYLSLEIQSFETFHHPTIFVIVQTIFTLEMFRQKWHKRTQSIFDTKNLD